MRFRHWTVFRKDLFIAVLRPFSPACPSSLFYTSSRVDGSYGQVGKKESWRVQQYPRTNLKNVVLWLVCLYMVWYSIVVVLKNAALLLVWSFLVWYGTVAVLCSSMVWSFMVWYGCSLEECSSIMGLDKNVIVGQSGSVRPLSQSPALHEDASTFIMENARNVELNWERIIMWRITWRWSKKWLSIP